MELQERVEFYRGIRTGANKDPADQSTCLMVADGFEDRGDFDRAAFIQLQCMQERIEKMTILQRRQLEEKYKALQKIMKRWKCCEIN